MNCTEQMACVSKLPWQLSLAPWRTRRTANSRPTGMLSGTIPGCGIPHTGRPCSAVQYPAVAYLTLEHIVQWYNTRLRHTSRRNTLFSGTIPGCGIPHTGRHCSAVQYPAAAYLTLGDIVQRYNTRLRHTSLSTSLKSPFHPDLCLPPNLHLTSISILPNSHLNHHLTPILPSPSSRTSSLHLTPLPACLLHTPGDWKKIYDWI